MFKSARLTIAKVQPLFSILESNNIDPGSFLKSNGLDPGILNLPDNLITLDIYAALIKQAIILTNDTYIGLHMGESISRFSNIIGYILMNCDTLVHAFQKYEMYQKAFEEIFNTNILFKNQKVQLSVEIINVDDEIEKQLSCYNISGFLSYIDILTGKIDEIRHSMEITFKHAKPVEADEYSRIFKCKVSFDNPVNSIMFDKKNMYLPVLNPNKNLLMMFEQYAQEIIKKIDVTEEYSLKVSRVILDMIKHKIPKIEDAAKELAISTRGLQLKLNDEGTSFRQIINDIRKNIALEYLNDKTITISEISYLPGFSEVSAFHRAFKKWTDCTPAMYREMLAAGQ